ncbi:MAG TPA: hypothetical protein VI483_00875 [Candidatus Paceibacterota bacterium]
MQSKHIIAAIGATSLLFTALPAFAQTTPPPTGAAFCTNLSNITSKINANVTTREQKIADHRTDVATKKTERWASRDQQLSTKRIEADAKRAAKYAELDAKATTDEQKAAVAQFRTDVEAAVVTRKAAVDAAVAAYRSGVDTALQAHVDAMSAAEATFKTSVDAAIAKAESDCANGIDGATARNTLRTSITAARDAFKTARKDNTLEGKRQELAAARKASIDAAMAAFRTTLEQAKVELKAALPASTTAQ